jgi:hypothetical protein
MEAPFKPGDKVVYVSKENILDPTTHYTIHEVFYCCSKYGYRVVLCEIGFTEAVAKKVGTRIINNGCNNCGNSKDGWLATSFRKVDDISNHTADSLIEELSYQGAVFA